MNDEMTEGATVTKMKSLSESAFKDTNLLPSKSEKDGPETYRHWYQRREHVEKTNLVIFRASDLLMQVTQTFHIESGERKQTVEVNLQMMRMVA